jgi:hypothetical protein
MDRTADSLVYTLTNTSEATRMEDAPQALIGIAPTLHDESVDAVLDSMTYISANSSGERRRRVAQKVLIACKGVQGLR